MPPELNRPSRLEHRLIGKVTQASRTYQLLEPDDRVMVCLSGGKDSYAMLHLLRRMQSVVPFVFDLIAVNLDQGQPGFPTEVLPTWLEAHDYEYRIVKRNTYAIVTKKVPSISRECSQHRNLRLQTFPRSARVPL